MSAQLRKDRLSRLCHCWQHSVPRKLPAWALVSCWIWLEVTFSSLLCAWYSPYQSLSHGRLFLQSQQGRESLLPRWVKHLIKWDHIQEMIYLIHSFIFAMLLVGSCSQSCVPRERLTQGCKTGGKDHGATLGTVHQLSDAPAFSSLSLATWPYKMAHKMEETKVDAY